MITKIIKQIKNLDSFIQAVSNPKTICHAQELIKISDLARAQGKFIAAQGGFAVDLAVGSLTRKHDDLDVVVLRQDLPYFKSLLIEQGYEIDLHEGMGPKWTFNANKYFPEIGDRVYIDFDGIEISGEIVSDGEGKDKYIWPITTSKLFWERKVGENPLIFLSPYLVYAFKKKQQAKDTVRNKEAHDFSRLEEIYPDISSKDGTYRSKIVFEANDTKVAH